MGTKRGIKLDTLEIQSMFTNTVVVNPERTIEYVKIATPESSLLFTGTIYTKFMYNNPMAKEKKRQEEIDKLVNEFTL